MDPTIARRRLIAKVVVLVAVMSAWLDAWLRHRLHARRSITYGPMHQRDQERQNNLRFIYESTDVECVDLLRMRRAPFMQLCDLFRTRQLLRDSIHSSVEEQVAMFLHVVGHNQRFRVVHMTFRRSIETINRYFREVLYAVGELRNEMILPPSTATPTKIRDSHRWYPYFKDCIGAIDGTHVLARVPRNQRAAFLGRKHTTTQNILAAVDFDLRFTYVLAGWEGSTHDALILADALEREDGLKVPQGKFYLVDAGYAVRPGFLPPYRATRYHLSEYGGRNPQNPKELFNLRHSSLRVTIERAFGALKDRFKILYNKPFHPYKTQDHPKDVDYLNRPIENYMAMQIIFGSGVATGRFAMGSNEPLGKPSDIVDILDDGIEVTSEFVDASNLTGKGKTVDKGTPGDSIDTKPMSNLGKRKSIRAEAAPGIYNVVINCPGFSREALMYALNHMMEHKATSLVFLDMTPDDRDLWLKTFLAKHYHN
ncbi:uncharacterized protein [Zea mays]|uniref:uncharacterized protein n=1 Tax=Zea mays TaxID=4577 RepID=UPI000C6C7F04|nr:uncharacterized protein LOC111590172 [Zea mays]|eukprot:XP_023156871.1 uncharacterized protein LOC111590172 [Zea mays]